MPCWHPLTGYYSKEVGPSGKRRIVFQRDASFSGAALRLPCGRCSGCRLERSRQWAMRCVHESKLWPANSFITLTYDDKFLPPGGTLVKRDFQLFMKRLRDKFVDHTSKESYDATRVRFYACGEYGELNRRPHYHAILFNVAFKDRVFFKKNYRGENWYVSKVLDDLWGNGYASVADVSFDSAAYVARYVMKKIDGPLAEVPKANGLTHYEVYDENGEIFRRLPEFTLMSRDGGIGINWYKRYGAETYNHDSVIINGRPVRPPRFYDGKFEVDNPTRLAALKKLRKRKAALQFREGLVDRRRVRERVQQLTMKHFKRSI